MKVLHIISTYKPAYIYGGPIISISKLCESLAERKDVSILVMTTNANGTENLLVNPNTEVIVDCVPVIYFKRITGDPHEISPSLWFYLFKHAKQYDIIHIHAWWNLIALLSALICVIRGKKLIVSPRGMLSQYILETNNRKQKKIIHRFFGRYVLSKSFYHATSEQEFEECKSLIPEWKGFMIPNLVKLPQIGIVKEKKAVFTIGFLSRIDPKKGIEFVFKAISELSFPVLFSIAGNGDENYIAELQQLALQLGIADKIKWTGWKGLEEKFYELMRFDLFVLSSFNENFANVVIEALYMGTPVCISRYVGLASFVEANRLGWVTDLTTESVAQAISDCYFDTEKRRAIETSSRNVILTHFSEEKVIEEYIHMYKTVLHSSVK